ncbi:MAG: hypothetical protein ACE5IY_14785 [bacterium]
MVEIDARDVMSLRNATGKELIRAFIKLDWYFEYGPKRQREECLERISNLLLEIRARKIMGERLTAADGKRETADVKRQT